MMELKKVKVIQKCKECKYQVEYLGIELMMNPTEKVQMKSKGFVEIKCIHHF